MTAVTMLRRATSFTIPVSSGGIVPWGSADANDGTRWAIGDPTKIVFAADGYVELGFTYRIFNPNAGTNDLFMAILGTNELALAGNTVDGARYDDVSNNAMSICTGPVFVSAGTEAWVQIYSYGGTQDLYFDTTLFWARDLEILGATTVRRATNLGITTTSTSIVWSSADIDTVSAWVSGETLTAPAGARFAKVSIITTATAYDTDSTYIGIRVDDVTKTLAVDNLSGWSPGEMGTLVAITEGQTLKVNVSCSAGTKTLNAANNGLVFNVQWLS
jgi:hypothetical protein